MCLCYTTASPLFGRFISEGTNRKIGGTSEIECDTERERESLKKRMLKRSKRVEHHSLIAVESRTENILLQNLFQVAEPKCEHTQTN